MKVSVKKYFNIKELSEYSGLQEKTLYGWAAQGKIPSIKIGRKVLFEIEEIERLLQSQKRPVSDIDKMTEEIVERVTSLENGK